MSESFAMSQSFVIRHSMNMRHMRVVSQRVVCHKEWCVTKSGVE